MIKFEHNTLVLDSSHTKEDQKAVNDFIEYITTKQREELEKANNNLIVNSSCCGGSTSCCSN